MAGAGSSRGPGRAQLLVRETMLAAGGYWRPLAAVARLLEELGEVAELLATHAPPADELAGELADLWIITTALADQYLADVPEPCSAQGGPASASASASGSASGSPSPLALIAAAGAIARVVNHYDGPKTPRTGARMPSLAGAVAAFHVELRALAGALRLDLATAVTGKLRAIGDRGDLSRFERSGHDPSTAAVLDRYRAALGARAPQRLWGGPDWGEQTEECVDAFAKAAAAEGLEALVLAGPPAGEGRPDWAALAIEELGGTEEELVRRGVRMSAIVEGGDGERFLVLRAAGPAQAALAGSLS